MTQITLIECDNCRRPSYGRRGTPKVDHSPAYRYIYCEGQNTPRQGSIFCPRCFARLLKHFPGIRPPKTLKGTEAPAWIDRVQLTPLAAALLDNPASLTIDAGDEELEGN